MGLIEILKNFGSAALEAVYPAVCEVCGEPLVDGEDTMCLGCRHLMPRTMFHREDFNDIHQRLASPGLPIERAGSYFYYFRDNPYARLLQKAKYNHRPGIARKLGQMYASEILTDGFFDEIDVLLPVAIHWRKRLKRGYNQSEEISKGVSAVTGIPIGDNFVAASHSTQTRKNAYERMINTAGVISVRHSEELNGRHVLIVDDIVTTGSTLIACVGALFAACSDVKVSVMTIGATKLY